MLNRATSPSSSLVFGLLLFPALAIATELQVGKAQEGALHNGRGDAYTVMLKAWDYVEANVDRRDTELVVTVYDPSGREFRAYRIDPGYGNRLFFAAESNGSYRLEVNGAEQSKTGSYSITLTKVVSVDARLAPAPPLERYESSRIKKLKADLSAGKQDALAGFWKDIAAKTTPLVEPLEGDNQHMLVTFLWRGDENTRNVAVLWFPYVRGWPDDYRMVHLADTNVWCKTLKISRQARFVYRLAPNASFMRPTRERDPERLRMFMASGQTDPLNPRHWLHFPDNPDAARYQDWSAAEMPDAPPQPWVEPRPGVPAGSVEQHQFKSDLLKNERELSVYLPPGYDKRGEQPPYGLIVLFDGGAYVATKAGPPLIPATTTLDNLIAEKRIPPVVALFIGSPPGMRDAELACNPEFLDSLHKEMVPWVRQHYNVTHDPGNAVVGGLSLGGFAAACAALQHPEIFGNVLSQSGGFFRVPFSGSGNPLAFNPEAESNWMARQFIASPRLQVRFYMTIGTDEFEPSGTGDERLASNRHLRDVLLAKGYEVHYQEYAGGHDFLSWRGSLADGLIALIGSD